ncbi:MAG: PPOX class F420-dependent oxidoreductase [Gordonia sp.]|uniref:PPOX class F420-dependent oxidoreductase n=1 Tax=Williamsia sp. 1138 TaxID=1903117 RepID=UPI000A102CE5|nr:PPOX class F420-dependent oxidoreductase [Williamsia sp. 1138]MBA4025162.1 PPOX class F420-dependent oxidoreductase [Gordonia sp. (in: high G+C Gram-positive bacteria)]OZG30919.1 PPOX class F420-dependent oxidoreductase [Williamsia sp. 1138]
MTAPFGQAGTAKYVQLTTFRKDGTPVATPLWAALDGDKLLMWTVTDSWKVKRIRRNPEVLVQACDARGKKAFGDVVRGTAEIQDADGTAHTRKAIAKKYGILGWITVKGSQLRRGDGGTVGLSITATG